MKVNYQKFPEIPQGCQLNYNKLRDTYQVFREYRVTDSSTGKRKTVRESIGQIKNNGFTFSKLYLERKKNRELKEKLEEINTDKISERSDAINNDGNAENFNEVCAYENSENFSKAVDKISASLKRSDVEARKLERIVYPLEPIAQAAIMSSLSGSSDCHEIAQYLNENKEYFDCFHEGIPEKPLTHDIVYRAFLKISSQKFESFYEQILSFLLNRVPENSVVRDEAGKPIRIICADGQAIRATSKGTDTTGHNDSYMLMNFYDINRKICIKQKLIEKKTNEISVGPKMLDSLDIKNAIVTADAMSCQMRFVESVLNGSADYCLALKGNQEKSWDEVRVLFLTTHPDQIVTLTGDTDLNHGRIEKRDISLIKGSLLSSVLLEKWMGLRDGCVIKVTSEKVVKKTGAAQTEERYYISSLPCNLNSAKTLREVIRSHWKIENNLHWLLDVNFLQDRMQATDESYITNRAALNKMALAMLEHYRFWLWNKGKTSEVLSIKAVRQRCRKPDFALECIACSQGFL